jgi:MFS family permease
MAEEAPSLRRRALALGAYWLLSMAPLGLLLPYYGLYLRENAGLDGARVGAVFAVMPLVGIFAQTAWGVAADRTGLRARVLVALCAGSAVGMLALGRAEGFASILAATALLAVFARALIPLSLSVTIPALADHPHAFGWVRALGTLGFGAAMFGFPALLARWQEAHALATAPGGPSEPGLGLLFPAGAVLAAAAAMAALAVPNRGVVALRARRGEWRTLARNGPFVRLLAVCAGAFLFQNGPMELFPILVRDRGGDLSDVRSMWLLMLAPELVLIAFLGVLTARLDPRALLAIGLAAGGLRWLGCAFAPSIAWLAPLQVLHAVVVTGVNLGAPLYADAVVAPQLRSTAQALLGVVAVGFGGAASALGSGWLLERHGASAPYLAGGIGSLGVLLLLPSVLPRILRSAPRLASQPAR